MVSFILLVSTYLLVLTPASPQISSPRLPAEAYVLSAVYVEAAPEIDGRLDDPAWMETNPLVFAEHPPPNGATTVKVKLLWDKQYLYAGFDINDTQVEGAEDTPWDGDSVSLILDSEYVEHEPETAEYRHSLLGIEKADRRADILSQHILKENTTYNNLTDEDTGYTVEMRIPWLTVPSAGTLINLDLLSVDHDNNPNSKYDAPDTVFSKIFWDNDNTVDKGDGYMILVDK